jgi:hypothetical protein
MMRIAKMLFSSAIIINVMNSRRMGWKGHVALIGEEISRNNSLV